MDPLSEVLAMLDLQVAHPSRFEAIGPWALRFDSYRHIKVGAVLSGQCWIAPARGPAVHLQAGDSYLLASGRPYSAASDLSLDPIDGAPLYEAISPSTTLRIGDAATSGGAEDDRFVQVCGGIVLDSTTAELLLDHIPHVARIPADRAQAGVLRPVLELLGQEVDDAAAGAATMREELTRILFVQVLRALLANGETGGWLRALGDPVLAPVLTAMHRDLGKTWTVAELAASAAMSRSAFAQRFSAVVGVPPLAYLTRLRIGAAGRMLRTSDRTVAAIANALGYESEGSLSTAFKRVTGRSPSDYRRRTVPALAAAARPPAEVGA